jgi:hypothetical protein
MTSEFSRIACKPPVDGVGAKWLALAAIAFVAAILFVGIGWFAPNFSSSHERRSGPLGGDFLQEYTGGRMWNDPESRRELYNLSEFRAAQHDEAALGFAWDEARYFPPVYPPFWYAACAPIAQLEYLTAARLWLALMTGCLVVAIVIMRRCWQAPWWLLAVTVISPPVLISLSSGQKGTLLLLIVMASMVLWRSGRPLASGAVFALIAFKPHLGLPIGLIMLMAGQWRWVTGTYLTLTVLLVASALAGVEVSGGYLDVCRQFTDYLRTGGYRLEEGFSLWAASQMVLGDPDAARFAAIVLSAIVLVLAGATCRRALRNHDEIQFARAVAIMVLATVLVAPHFYIYDLTLLLLPAAILARRPWAKANLTALALIGATLFGSQWLAQFSGATGTPVGPLLLVAALLAVTIVRQNAAISAGFVRVDANPAGL